MGEAAKELNAGREWQYIPNILIDNKWQPDNSVVYTVIFDENDKVIKLEKPELKKD